MPSAESIQREPLIQPQRAEDRANRTWRNFWCLLLIAPIPLMVPYLIELWQVEWYRYFPFVFAAVGVLVYLRWDRTFSPPLGWFSWAAIGFALFMVMVAAALRYPWFATLGFVIIAWSCLNSMKGRDDATLFGLGLPLLLLLRPPFRSDNVLIAELQSITTWLSSVFLDVLAVPHATYGNVMMLPKRELFVAEACSGVQSVFTLAFFACVLISWKRIRLWLFPVYLLVAVILAIAANTIRVTSIAVAESWLGLDLSGGVGHALLGYLCLLIGAGLLLSFDQLIELAFHPVEGGEVNPIARGWNRLAIQPREERSAINAEQYGRRERRFGASMRTAHVPKVVGWGFVATVAVVVIASVGQTIRSQRRQTLAVGSGQMLFAPPEDMLRGFVGSLKIKEHQSSRGNTNPDLGANSDSWMCEGDGVQAQIVLSQPYSGWKELCVCYEGGVWNLVNRTERLPDEDDIAGPDGSYAIGRFRTKDESGHNAYLFFSAIRPDGTVMAAPTRLGSLGTRFMHRLDYGGVWELDDVMMLQMWAVSNGRLSPETIQRLETDFVTARTMVLEAVRERAGWTEATSDGGDG